MAKKKKRSSKKKQPVEETKQSSGFWQLAWAILLILFGFFFLLGGFGQGGPLPVKLFYYAYELLGWAAYLTPVALVYFGFHKFKSEDRRIPLINFLSMFSFLAMSSALFYSLTVKKDLTGEWTG